MSFAHPELLAPSIISLVLVLYPAPWHVRSRNLATLSMIFWMTGLNLVHIVNCIAWSDNADIKVKVWGDISTALIVGYNYGLPISHFILAKQLESYTSLRPHSPLHDSTSRRHHQVFDLSAAFAGPVAGILVHLSMMDRRYYVVEAFGPMPATYWNTWGVIAMAIVPIVIAGACAVYTGELSSPRCMTGLTHPPVMALVNIHLRRQQMLSFLASHSSVNREQFMRLLFLTLAELGTCGLRAIFNLMSFQHGPQPFDHRGPPSHNLSIIETVHSPQITSSGLLILRLQFFTVVACSAVFFLCFATSSETKKFYWRVWRKVMPCLPEQRQGRSVKLGSVDTAGGKSLSSGGQTTTAGTFSTSDWSKAHEPATPKEDISFGDMLSCPVVGQNPDTDKDQATKDVKESVGADEGISTFYAPYPVEMNKQHGELNDSSECCKM